MNPQQALPSSSPRPVRGKLLRWALAAAAYLGAVSASVAAAAALVSADLPLDVLVAVV